jgi:hypothetical protein
MADSMAITAPWKMLRAAICPIFEFHAIPGII